MSTATPRVTNGSNAADVQYPRVLVVAASPRIMGGQSVMAERLVSDLRNDGLEVEFQPVDSIPQCIEFIGKVKYLRTIVNTCFYVSALMFRVWRYDVVQIFSASYWSFLTSPTPAILVSKICGKKVILNYHSGEAEDHLRRSSRLTHWLLRLPDEIVVPSQFLVDVFSRFNFNASAIANNVDLRLFAYRARSVFHPKILIARALEPLYNISCAIRAFEVVKSVCPKAKLTILGSGSMRQQLENEVSALGLADVIFAGRIEHSDLPHVYDEHDIFLNTSSIDNMPVSILEAFASGLPVVTTDAGGIPYIVQHGVTGCVVKVDDHDDAAAQILALSRNPDLGIKLARAAKNETKKYTWDTVGPQWISLYCRLHAPVGKPARKESGCAVRTDS